MKIFLIRHGQSESDIEDRYGGDYDDALTVAGQQQVREMAQGLKDKGIERVLASPRKRARQSAEILAQVLDIELEVVDNLRECNRYGIMTGLEKSQAQAKYPQLVQMLSNYATQLPGGEAYVDFRKRVLASFESIASQPYKTVSIVTHGGPIRCLLREKLRMGELQDVLDCAVLELRWEDSNITIISDAGILKN